MTERKTIVKRVNGRWWIFRSIDNQEHKTHLNFDFKMGAINHALILSRREGNANVVIWNDDYN